MEIIKYKLFFVKEIEFLVSVSPDKVTVSCSHGTIHKSELFTDLSYARCFENLVLFSLTSMNLASKRPIPIQIKTSFKGLISILRQCDQIGYSNLSRDLQASLLMQLHTTINEWLMYVQFITALEIDYVCESTIAFLCIFNSLQHHFFDK